MLGHLQHAAAVVRPGRTFARRLMELVPAFRDGNHWIRLNALTRSDLTWWRTFMESWNGIILRPELAVRTQPLKTDASGTWGCGASWGMHWFQWKWEGPSQEWAIAQKELLAILFAMVVWGREWHGQRVECHCDNAAVVAVVNTCQLNDKVFMHLLRCMFLWLPGCTCTYTWFMCLVLPMYQLMNCHATIFPAFCRSCHRRPVSPHPFPKS